MGREGQLTINNNNRSSWSRSQILSIIFSLTAVFFSIFYHKNKKIVESNNISLDKHFYFETLKIWENKQIHHKFDILYCNYIRFSEFASQIFRFLQHNFLLLLLSFVKQ